MRERSVPISTENIKLDAFLKWAGVVQTGGEAKQQIQRGEVRVNNAPERRRGRLLRAGDRVGLVDGSVLVVVRG